MRSKQRVLHLSVLLIFLVPAFVCRADDRARDRASLSGIQRIVVNVRTFDREWAPEIEAAGLTESVLQALIERQLEKAGIAVVSEEASKKTGTEGILIVRIEFKDFEPPKKVFSAADNDKIEKFDAKKKYIYAIRLNLRQLVSLQRAPEETISAITWQTESLGLRRLADIREDFKNVVNRFVEAYLSQNPGSKKP